MALRRLVHRASITIVTVLTFASRLTTAFAVPLGAENEVQGGLAQAKTVEIPFTSHDGYEMFGKLTIPASNGLHAVVIYVQTAEGATVDVKRSNGHGGTFNYFDLYRVKLPEMNVAFFSYEGRGVRMGDKPPRYETIDWDIYNTSTLENKVRDIITAVQVVKKQPGVDANRMFLMGASEGTLLEAEAAARMPDQITGLIMYGVLSTNMRENFRYIVTGGAFLTWRRYFDTDRDGKISKQEYEADPKKFREKVLKNAPFATYDKNGDGFITVEDYELLYNPLRDAVDKDNYEVLNHWAKTTAGATTPKDWFKDHFAHPAMWTFLSKLNIPMGFFQGGMDPYTPIAGVKNLEEMAKKTGKSKMEFHYFDDLDHALNIYEYFENGAIPAGHTAIFEFIRRQTAGRKG
jgi:pimeloyl-ACP methyl ester carboxylesterase